MVFPRVPGVTLTAEIGRGASSVVYRGEAAAGPCAVKIPTQKGLWTRWVYREAVALARVRHARLPRVLEVGDLEGLPYLVLELVEGETLASRIARGRLPETDALALGLELATALAAVHGVGLVHRDVKPRNIVLGPSGARLLDFGFATGLERISRETSAPGTPLYAAPEQRSAPSRVDGRADLYALGLVLVEAITGAVPVDRSGTSLARALEGRASPATTALLQRLVHESPEQRPEGAELVANALAALLEEEIAPSKSSTPTRLPGRAREVELLTREVRELRGRGGKVATVLGERGAGKSRLLETAAASLPEVATAFAACREGDPPLALVRRLVAGLLAALRHTHGAEALGPLLRHRVRPELWPFASLLSPDLGALLGASAVTTDLGHDGFPEAVADVLADLARQLPRALVCVDDAHAIDPLSRRVLVALADQIDGVPIVLAIGARTSSVEVTSGPILAAARGRGFSMELHALEARDVEEIVTAYLGAPPPSGLAERIAGLAEGTPLGVLELLAAYLDVGAVRPRAGSWTFDEARAAHITLPGSTTALLARRIAELPPEAARILAAAAVHASVWDEDLLAELFDIPADDVARAAEEGRRARLVDVTASGEVRFVHDSVRETLREELPETERRGLHQRIAETLDRRAAPDFDLLCAIAEHFGGGLPDRARERASEVQEAAAEAALSRGANETALRFLVLAAASSQAANRETDARHHALRGEAHLRLGDLEASAAAFEAALRRHVAPLERARLLGRLALVRGMRGEPEAAWRALGEAFALLGERMPVESVGSALRTTKALAELELPRPLARLSAPRRTPAEAEFLCQLHYQNARLGTENARIARIVQSTVAGLAVGRAIGDSPALARALATQGIVMMAAARHEAGRRAAEEAERIARKIGDPKLLAFVVQARAVGASLADDWDLSIALIQTCVDEHGPWLDLDDYCSLANTADLLLTARGHARRALAWMNRAWDRVRRRQKKDGVTPIVLLRVDAALAAAGKETSSAPQLASALATLGDPTSLPGFNAALAWGPILRALVDRGEVGPELDARYAACRKAHPDPRRMHAALSTELFNAMFDAEILRSLRGPRSARKDHARALRTHLADARKAIRQPRYEAHFTVVEGHAAWLEGNLPRATELLARAEELAAPIDSPAVTFMIARTRAHALLDRGHTPAAKDQGRIAQAVAVAHGAVARARWVEQELGLPSLDDREESRSSLGTSSGARQLRTLMSLARAPRGDAPLAEQARQVAEEVIRTLGADACFLRFAPEDQAAATVAFVDATGASLELDARRRELLDDSARSGMPVEHTDEAGTVLAVPLYLFDRVVGAVAVESAPGSETLDATARAVLGALASQVTVALELARLLADREQLQASLLQAQRMEAVGHLSGGIAHDFNNMLSAIQASTDAIADATVGNAAVAEELTVVREAAQRASQLTKQLLSFSKHRPVPLARVETAAVLEQILPILQRLVGTRVKVSLEIEEGTPAMRSEIAGLEQALVNLASNARDAMKKRGTLTLRARTAVLGEEAVARGAPAAGTYVAIDVVDTGEGMSREVLARIFDPFFSTKTTAAGTGLGLTTVYTFAKRSGGHVEVESAPGAGTTFTLYLPRDTGETPQVEEPRSERRAGPRSAEDRRRVILVVDDDPLARTSILRTLRREGYEVLVAETGEGAQAALAARQGDVALVVLDVILPGDTGTALAQRWETELAEPPKFLFVSGFSPETLPTPEAGLVRGGPFLQKPFSNAALLGQVAELLGKTEATA